MAEQDLMQSQDPMQQQMVGTPPPFMQGGISPMMMGAPPGAGGVLPPSNPIDAAQEAPQPGIQAAMSQMAQTAAGGPGQVGGLYGREQAAMGPQMGGGLPDLIKQHEAFAPHTAHQFSFQQGQGAGGFFHNLGQALLALGMATRPGQAAEKAIYAGPRAEYAAQAEQIKGLQDQQKLTQEPEPGLAAVPYHAALVGIGQQKADAATSRAASYATRVTDQHSNELVKQAQGWDRLSNAEQKTKIDQWYKQKMLPIMEERIAAGERNTDVKADAIKSLGAAAQSNKLPIDHPLIMGAMDLIEKMTGTDVTPGLQAPAGASTVPMKPGKAPSSPEASRAAASPKSRAVASGAQHKVGDTVIVNGRQVKIGKIYPDGTFDPAP